MSSLINIILCLLLALCSLLRFKKNKASGCEKRKMVPPISSWLLPGNEAGYLREYLIAGQRHSIADRGFTYPLTLYAFRVAEPSSAESWEKAKSAIAANTIKFIERHFSVPEERIICSGVFLLPGFLLVVGWRHTHPNTNQIRAELATWKGLLWSEEGLEISAVSYPPPEAGKCLSFEDMIEPLIFGGLDKGGSRQEAVQGQ